MELFHTRGVHLVTQHITLVMMVLSYLDKMQQDVKRIPHGKIPQHVLHPVNVETSFLITLQRWQNLYTAISFQSNQYTAIEGVDESVTITVVRYGDNSSDLCVSISISGGNEGEPHH